MWLQKGNDMDKILVVSNHAKTSYEGTEAFASNNQTGETFPYKLKTPIDVVWETTPRADPEPIPNMELEFDFNFVMVSQFGPRKNLINALQWWVEEFIDQEVGLVLKTNISCNSIMDWEHLSEQVAIQLSKYKERKCKVYLLHGDLTPGQMTELYTNPKWQTM